MDDIWQRLILQLHGAVSGAHLLELILAVTGAACLFFVKRISLWLKSLYNKIMLKNIHVLDTTVAQNYDAIRTDLFDLRKTLNASRISIYQFHNGDTFTTANPIFKLTCTHESVRRGLQFDSYYFKYELVSGFLDLIGPLLDKNRTTPGVEEVLFCDKYADVASCQTIENPLRVLKFSIEDMSYSYFKYIMEQQGTFYAYATMLYADSVQHPIGILCVQFTDGQPHTEDIKANICALCSSILRVQFMLDTVK